ncbi:MAG: gluconate 2-dehydrogenase subunit 3 family protein [Sinobacteraceae bacterium]|nr:gluconate 2-dehydrogenase subunit 3 family protein [Nevskiaceae bacterium]
MTGIRRRDLLTGTVLLLANGELAKAEVISGHLPWHPGATAAPEPAKPGNWSFLTDPEAATLGAIADRIIPADPQTPGGKDAGCVVFVDRQLAGAYGRREGLYVAGPFEQGTKEQGPQSPQTPGDLYRAGLAALDKYCRAGTAPGHGKAFVALTAAQQDEVLHGLESGSVQLEGIDGKTFFEQLLKDIQQGFFADPIYGGNHEMCAWKMIGFPGARYDYTDWVGRHNERYPLPPVSIAGRDAWNSRSR